MSDLQNKLLDVVNRVDTFVVGEMPEYVNQLVMYGFANNIAALAFSLLLLRICLYIFNRLGKSCKDNGEWSFEEVVLFFPTLLIMFAVLLVMFTSSIHDLIQLTFAPKAWVIEYILELK